MPRIAPRALRRRIWLACLALLLAACSGKAHAPVYQEQGYVFGTLVEVSIYGAPEARARRAVKAVMEEFQRLHVMLHAWQPSRLTALNEAIAHGKRKLVTPELAAMLQDAAQLSERSQGLFNPAIGGLVGLWGFHADTFKPRLPDQKRVAAWVRADPEMSDLTFSPAKDGKVWVASRNRAVQIDLGGYAKGYALDRAAAILKKMGVKNALINIGGNILALGRHGSRPWRVGIQDPRKPGPLATLDLNDGEAIGTSGDYQRFFEVNGKRYCHLIDPRSGQPVQGVEEVTILTHGARAGVRSDADSKPLFLSGVAGWRAAARRLGVGDAMLVDGDGRVHITAGLRNRIKFTNKSTVAEVAP